MSEGTRRTAQGKGLPGRNGYGFTYAGETFANLWPLFPEDALDYVPPADADPGPPTPSGRARAGPGDKRRRYQPDEPAGYWAAVPDALFRGGRSDLCGLAAELDYRWWRDSTGEDRLFRRVTVPLGAVAANLRVDERTVRRWVDDLEALGLIVKLGRNRAGLRLELGWIR